MSAAQGRRSIGQQLLVFVRGHLIHVVLLVPGVLLLTWVHEAAHSLLVLILGGSITEFQWLPSASGLGHIRFTFPKSMDYSPNAISLAPHVLSVLFMTTALCVSFYRPVRSDRAASWIFFWLYFLPAADIGFALLVWTLGGDNDIAKAFGPRSTASTALAIIYAMAVSTVGYVVQRRLYDKLRLGPLPYFALVLTGLLLMGGVLGLLTT